ncbi:alpha-N-acetylglucosaminidase [Tunturiibacter gelidoferens]|uniref:Alpha-N-acetylglucosaminidase n=1 Tax=Tunturiibacter gelidiferens TaxID=3069689 RepID=A0A9X0QDP0_9BACT|nr:alpha-N-acetylglucosaminidase [Edaphobacter lichenicola]MBB5328466.1 alpha-N-acetylglucosaminidase [Edaphobacter lichenicola]
MLPKQFFAIPLLAASLVTASTRAESPTAPAQAVLQRLMPNLAPQFQLALIPKPGRKDYFRITGIQGHIRVEAATQPTLLYGVNWYLKFVAHLQISPNGSQLGAPNLTLPAPDAPIEKPALYPWRYALNENVDGYSAPYWDQQRWQHEIDILALSGTNAILIERGMDLVLYQTFRDAGYSDQAIRNWIVQPAHQNWQLMGNMCCFQGTISMELLEKRSRSAQQLIASLRSLGITPVLPGYYGIVPADFASLHPGAHVITQGDWNGFTRPGWLDPRDPNFDKLAASFYRHQHALYGDSAIYDMEIFQEGGAAGDVPVAEAAKKVQQALMRDHPNALWMLLGWQQNPTQELLSSLDTSHVLIAEIEQGRIPREDRDREFRGASWLYGGLWEFGGRTTMGAPLYDYAVRLPKMSAKPNSRIVGTAIFTEGMDTNPFAFDLYTEMAWHANPVTLTEWTDAYAIRRYGANDPHAQSAWQILLKTAYGYRADGNTQHGERDASQDSIFNAQPSLTATRAATWSPDVLRYNPSDLAPALTELLQVAPTLRSTETYQYDLVDVARQTMANEGRRLLPLIKQAYDTKDKITFAKLTKEWLRDMELQNQLLQTSPFFLLGKWLSFVPPWASSPEELDRLNYDARSILTTWGDRKASEYGLHEYGNRDWAGLTSDYYMVRWQMYFDSLSTALDTVETPKAIDWYAFGDQWNHSQKTYAATPHGDSYDSALAIAHTLHLAPNQQSEAHQ